MTNAEKKALAAKLREQMKEAKPDPADDSLEILAAELVSTENPQ